jgi:hypothetical protein
VTPSFEDCPLAKLTSEDVAAKTNDNEIADTKSTTNNLDSLNNILQLIKLGKTLINISDKCSTF